MVWYLNPPSTVQAQSETKQCDPFRASSPGAKPRRSGVSAAFYAEESERNAAHGASRFARDKIRPARRESQANILLDGGQGRREAGGDPRQRGGRSPGQPLSPHPQERPPPIFKCYLAAPRVAEWASAGGCGTGQPRWWGAGCPVPPPERSPGAGSQRRMGEGDAWEGGFGGKGRRGRGRQALTLPDVTKLILTYLIFRCC